MRQFLAHLSYPVLVIFTLLLGFAPFRPEPHVVEKVRLLLQGALSRPIDIFDLFFHLAPALLLLAKLAVERPWRQENCEE